MTEIHESTPYRAVRSVEAARRLRDLLNADGAAYHEFAAYATNLSLQEPTLSIRSAQERSAWNAAVCVRYDLELYCVYALHKTEGWKLYIECSDRGDLDGLSLVAKTALAEIQRQSDIEFASLIEELRQPEPRREPVPQFDEIAIAQAFVEGSGITVNEDDESVWWRFDGEELEGVLRADLHGDGVYYALYLRDQTPSRRGFETP
jgi:hypothetical protein